MNRPKRATTRKADSGRDKDVAASGPKIPKWDDAVAGQPDASFQSYDPAARYAPGGLVLHTKFGKGLVVDVEPGKVTLLFQDGLKKLVHAG